MASVLISGSADMEVRIWDCDSRLCTHRLQAPLKKEISGVSMASNTVIHCASYHFLSSLVVQDDTSSSASVLGHEYATFNCCRKVLLMQFYF
jgi:WD40 repeat protein